MSTDDEQHARLTALAEAAWPDQVGIEVTAAERYVAVRCDPNRAILFEIAHDRAREAAEAALLCVSGEVDAMTGDASAT